LRGKRKGGQIIRKNVKNGAAKGQNEAKSSYRGSCCLLKPEGEGNAKMNARPERNRIEKLHYRWPLRHRERGGGNQKKTREKKKAKGRGCARRKSEDNQEGKRGAVKKLKRQQA